MYENGETSIHKLTRIASIATPENEEELSSKGIDVNELLREMLKRRKEEIAATKEEIEETMKPTKSHYIPKCSIATCQKPATIIHHTQRLSLSHNHDPRFLAPLCSEHHVIAHSIDFQYHQARTFALQ